ncbi:hypothetical protein K437DRAFT_259769 [Tilletiaria anomala UBC 951]|uniref:RRM domain-containing protein n=1 Tax=Tilletiaria anomala (strain ATCC 24038 / CBS 436.72 / UBC 951) TaxID=1037660 RepID=A0A066V708_TILAU|nr:uncharacterized protein K437DRAFT_259769 [Tilletiaria anomala UBC 951]KDN37532.1 hypothetical protein K437DRAFT_259769 [Tilletiaria anomala UBC 951]
MAQTTVATAAGAATVQVTGLSATTTKQSLEEYFSFCGSIASSSIEIDADVADKQKATVTFLKSSAASNAAMLNGGQLDGTTVHVAIPCAEASVATKGVHTVPIVNTSFAAGYKLAQEDKPHSAIVAEVLAHGYKLSDDITKRAIELDNKHGLSTQFRSYLEHIDRQLGQRYAQAQVKNADASTTQTQEKAKDEEVQQAVAEEDASKLPAPGAIATSEGLTTTTEVLSAGAAATGSQGQSTSFVAQVQSQAHKVLNDPNSIVGQAQSRANEILNRPDVKSRTDFVWSKFGEYYNKAANHPSIKGFYEKASKTVADVHEEAKRIKEQKAAGDPTGATGSNVASLPAGVPAPSFISKSSSSWLLVALLLFSSISIQGTLAHGGIGEEMHPADIAGVKPNKPGEESYVQKHMASEHHIGAFDLGSFFSLHDLNRDGVLDRAEIEAIYGVHHSTSVKHSPSPEVHDEKAEKVVAEVLRRLDSNNDGMVTKREFINGGPNGLPAFEQYGKGVLGHHYDEESEYFVHHEEIYHNTPESQKDESYNHKADVEHFAHHEAIEREEEQRERHAEGMLSIEEDERMRKEAEAKGQTYRSPYEAQQHAAGVHDGVFYGAQRGEYYGGYAQEEAQGDQHIFRGPSGAHLVKSHAATDGMHDQEEHRLPGETSEGYSQRRLLWEQRKNAAAYFEKLQEDQNKNGKGGAGIGAASGTVKVQKLPGESDEAYRSRLNKAKWAAEKQQGATKKAMPKDPAMKKGAPYKYPPIGQKQSRLKKSSYFGEF